MSAEFEDVKAAEVADEVAPSVASASAEAGEGAGEKAGVAGADNAIGAAGFAGGHGAFAGDTQSVPAPGVLAQGEDGAAGGVNVSADGVSAVESAAQGEDADASEGAAAQDAPSEEELAAARELAEHNALADVFDDVRKQSADSHLVTPDRWAEIGLVPDHMTPDDFEMFVYEWLEDYLTEHKEEIEAERAAERAKAASVRSATRKGVGCPPKIPNRRLAQIKADEQAKQKEEAEQAAQAAAEGAAGAAVSDGAVAGAQAAQAAGASNAQQTVAETASASPASPATVAVSSLSDSAAQSDASPSVSAAGNADDDASPFAGLRIPEGYRLEQIEGQWTLVQDENAAPVRKEIKCNRIKVLVGMHSYYLYDETLMTNTYAHWAFLAAEDNPVVTFVECVREDARVYPRPYAAECLKNPPFRMTDEQIEQTWQAVCDSGNYPDIERTQASNGDVYYYSTKYLTPEYAASLAEYDAVERPADV